MTKAAVNRIRKAQKGQAIENAIRHAIEDAREQGLDKPFDVAVMIQVRLKDAGFKIVRK